MFVDLAEHLARRLVQPLPGRAAQARFEPELSCGRHFAPPRPDARAAAVAVLLYPQGQQWYLPLTRRVATLAAHAGQISLPGGTVEPGESPEQAALRELHEELGSPSSEIRLLGRLSPLYLFVTNYAITPCVALAPERPAFTPQAAEVAELLELPLAVLLDPAARGRHVHEQRGMRMLVPHFAWRGHYIWGATSMILGELAAVVQEIYPMSPSSSTPA